MQWPLAELASTRLRMAREVRTGLQGKHSRAGSESPPEKQAKQHRPYESPSDSPHHVANEATDPQPSSREVAAANAARERLYGSRAGQTSAEEATARLPTGAEPTAVADVEYLSRAELQPCEDAASEMTAALEGCRASEWTTVCSGLLGIRRLAVHHKSVCWSHTAEVMPLVLKAVKSLRSSVSKTAIMAAADLIESFGDELLPALDVGGAARPAASLLSQLLLKGSSNDKKFVIDEVQRTLATAAEHVSPQLLLPRLLPYAAHKSPKVRGTAAGVVAASAERMAPTEWAAFGIEALLKLSGKLVSDNTPEARAAAKKLAVTLHAVFKEQVEEKENTEGLSPPINSPRESEKGFTKDATEKPFAQLKSSWEEQCRALLGGSQATAILKATEKS